MEEVNPLQEITFRIPFNQISAAHVEPAIARLLAEAEAKQRDLAESTGLRTFENTLLALETITEKLGFAMGVIGHLEGVATYPELRAAYNAVQPVVSLFYTNIVLDPGLWRVLKEYEATPEAKSLTGTKARFLKKTMDGFRREGADLDDVGKEKLKAIEVELSQITTKFGENVLDSTNDFELILKREEDLAGLPVSAVEAARENAQAKGLDGWRFTLQIPSYLSVMTYLDNRSVRETMYRRFSTRSTQEPFDNASLLPRIIELRQAKAKLLNFPTFADLVLEDRMAHDGASAKQFLERLQIRTAPRFQEENADLQAFRDGLEGAASCPIEPWDVAYYAEKQRQALYHFDEEELRPYFAVDRVLDGMFDLARRLFDIEVREETGVPAWDNEVKFFSVFDPDGTKLGSFYADWFPRENKRPGAWMDAFITGLPHADGFKPHLGLICGNMTAPVAGKPALLTHREVETVFHEFGHLLHHCLSRVEVRSLAGTNVSWDFVELPSQIMENWCWERESLDLLARHHETGELIPEELFTKMKRARNFRSANGQMRQLGFGIVDLILHTTYDPARDGDVLSFSRKLLQKFSPAPLPTDYGMLASFTHLFSGPVGYAAGYYSYKWAEVLDADAFTKFREAGIFSREVGRQFRAHILSRGNSEDPAELYRSFMGRDPDPSALLQRLGL